MKSDARLRSARKELTRDFDAVVTPPVPVAAPRLDEDARVPGDDPVSALFTVVRFTSLFNLTRHPTVTVPAGITESGLPVGLQLVGTRFRDPELLPLATSVENAIEFDPEPSVRKAAAA